MVRTLLFLGLAFLAVPAVHAEETGRDVMSAQKARLELQDEERVVSMDLVDARGKVRQRKVQMWNMRAENGLEKLMLVFLTPRDVEGTGLLTWEQRDRDDDQWLFLPSTGREKRIAAGAKKNKFMGTEFTFEDLRSENLDRHEYQLTGSEQSGGEDCFVIEAIPGNPKEAKESGYSKRVLWISKKTYLTLKVEYFDKRDQKIKVLENGTIVKLEGGAFRTDEAVMTNLRTKSSTRMTVVERKFNQGQDEQAFTLRQLKSL